MLTRRALLEGVGSQLVPAASRDEEERFAPERVRADLDAIWTTLQEVSPDPFRTASRARVEQVRRRIRAGLTEPMTVRAAWLALSPLLGALNDGHAGLGFPAPLDGAIGRFPLSFSVAEGDPDLRVRRDRTGVIPPGARVVSVEGVAAADLLRTHLRAFGAQTAALRRWRVSAAGPWTAVALCGARPAYRVRWLDAAGAERESVLAAGVRRSTAATPDEPYAFRWLRERRVGLIDYRLCEDPKRFRTFLDATFSELKAASAQALVIDVRRNAGGDSDLNDLLWSYAQGRPFKQFGGSVVRSSARLKRAYGRDRYVRLYGEAAWSAPDGVVLSETRGPQEELVRPGPLAVRFGGRVALLISAGTFSSGMACALAAKDYGLATIVGEETGEPAYGTGELYVEPTPELRIPAMYTTKLQLAPKPHPDGRGVTPDVAVADAPAATDADPVLTRALALL